MQGGDDKKALVHGSSRYPVRPNLYGPKLPSRIRRQITPGSYFVFGLNHRRSLGRGRGRGEGRRRVGC